MWSRYFKDETQFYMEWLSAPNNADHGVGRELVNAQDRICEKWKQKFHDFKPLEKVLRFSFWLTYFVALS